MGKKIEPTYLGDGVYAVEDDRGIVLTTGSHLISEADNVVVLEPKVWKALKRWVETPAYPDVECAHSDCGLPGSTCGHPITG